MKTKVAELRDELARVMEEHAEKEPTKPLVFAPELIRRVVEYVREQGKQGKSAPECCRELGLPPPRLHYWLYSLHRRGQLARPAGAMRPVLVSVENKPVYDGVPERRYTVRSPAGWQAGDLTLAELTQLLRSLP
jgi:hypothetical protein